MLPGTLAGELSFLKLQGTTLGAPPRRVYSMARKKIPDVTRQGV
jgi:hypothetical protein